MRVMLDYEPPEFFEVGDRVVVYSGMLQGEPGTVRYTPRSTRNGYYDVVLDKGGSCLVFEHSLKPAPEFRFQVDDRVRIKAKGAKSEGSDLNKHLDGLTGTVVKIDKRTYLVEFDFPDYRKAIPYRRRFYKDEIVLLSESEEEFEFHFSVGDRVEIIAPYNAAFVGHQGTIVKRTGGCPNRYDVKLDNFNEATFRRREENLRLTNERYPQFSDEDSQKQHNSALLWNMLLSEVRRVLRQNISPYASDEDKAPNLTIPSISDEITLTVGDLRALAREDKEDIQWT